MNKVDQGWQKFFAVLIAGAPQQQERHGFRVRGKRVNAYDPPKSKQAKKNLAAELGARRCLPSEPLETEIGVSLVFHEKLTGRQQAKDIDNYAKLVLDAMNGLVYADDVQVVQLEVKLVRGAESPGTEITVWTR